MIDARNLSKALGSLCLLLTLGCGMVDRVTGVKTACDLRATGVPAQAEILAIWETGWSVNNEPVIGIRVRVLADDRAPFEAEIPKALIGILQVPQFQPGRQVPVVYDPRDPSKVGLDIYTCK
ncbi:MAG: hypothetical protein ABI609_14235 [Acidobacteriota bacterium]